MSQTRRRRPGRLAPAGGYAVLACWPETPRRDAYSEVIDWPDAPGFTLADAECVARECRRRGARASVHGLAVARRELEALPLAVQGDRSC